MKPCFLLCTLLLSVASFSQSAPQNTTQHTRAALVNANDVMASVNPKQSPSYQANNWKAEAQQKPSNASAWLNYYLWTSRNKTLSTSEKVNQLSQIFSQAENNVSKSYEYFLMKYLQSNKKDSIALNKAFELSGDKVTLYQYKIQYAIIHNQKALVRKYALELNALMPMPSDLHEYHFNVLMSADSNAVIYAQGLNDLVPLTVLQEALNYRRDISLKYYDGSPVPEANAYLCLSLGEDIIKRFPKAGYTGLLLKVSGATIQELARNIERFDLRVMQSDNAIPGDDAPPIYKNYLPSLLLYYKFLKSSKNASVDEWKLLLERLSQRTGDKAAVEKQLND